MSRSSVPDVTVDWSNLFDSLHRNRQLLHEVVAAFREDAITYLAEFQTLLSEGRSSDAEAPIQKLQRAAQMFHAQPLLSVIEEILTELGQGQATALMQHQVPRLQTILQATIDTLRDQDLLKNTTRLHTPVERSSEELGA